jgi:hypothetical protein
MSAIGTGLGFLVANLVAVVSAVILMALIGVAFVSVSRDLWQLRLVFGMRPRVTAIAVIGIASVILSLGAAWLGPSHARAVLFVTICLTPWVCIKLVSLVAWWSDGPADRQLALDLFRSQSSATERMPSIDRKLPWASYIFDLERARRRATYEPPPI